MKIYEFNPSSIKGNLTYELVKAIRKCREEKYDKLVFTKAVYDIDFTFAEQRNFNISNHGMNGPKRMGLLIEDMDGFEVDFNGSTFITKGKMTGIAITNSKNITIKNVILENPETEFMQAKVVNTGEDFVDFEIQLGGDQFHTSAGAMYVNCGYEFRIPQTTSIEFRGDTGELEYGTGDFPIGFPWDVYNEKTKDNHFIVKNPTRIPPIGNIFVHTASRRFGCGIFCEDSENLYFENVIVHSCQGMGLLAQFCHNVTLDGFSTLRHGIQMYTANADATHFVHCTGLIKVENGTFEGQLDDALNIHGIYVRVIDRVSDNELLIKQMHFQATGLKIFQPGDKVQALVPETLIPYVEKTVKSVDVINDEIVKLTFVEDVNDVKVGDDLENLTKSADLIFRKNIVRDNRARGMLIAAKGKVLIEDNYFHASGAAILFEADGKYWFESGGTNDVTIKNNVFDRCKYSKFGTAVLQFVKREQVEEGKYYHGRVAILDNKFTMFTDSAIMLDNIESVTIKGNVVKDGKPAIVDVKHCKNLDLQKEDFTYQGEI